MTNPICTCSSSRPTQSSNGIPASRTLLQTATSLTRSEATLRVYIDWPEGKMSAEAQLAAAVHSRREAGWPRLPPALRHRNEQHRRRRPEAVVDTELDVVGDLSPRLAGRMQ